MKKYAFLLLLIVVSCVAQPTGEVIYEEKVYVNEVVSQKIPRTYEMNISGFEFVPNELDIGVGDRVVFQNYNGRSHKIREQSYREFESPWLDLGESYLHTFSQKGKYTLELLDEELELETPRRKQRPYIIKTATVEVRY